MYTRYLAQDLGPLGITANCIAPGYIGTGRLMERFEQVGRDEIVSRVALRRARDRGGLCQGGRVPGDRALGLRHRRRRPDRRRFHALAKLRTGCAVEPHAASRCRRASRPASSALCFVRSYARCQAGGGHRAAPDQQPAGVDSRRSFSARTPMRRILRAPWVLARVEERQEQIVGLRLERVRARDRRLRRPRAGQGHEVLEAHGDGHRAEAAEAVGPQALEHPGGQRPRPLRMTVRVERVALEGLLLADRLALPLVGDGARRRCRAPARADPRPPLAEPLGELGPLGGAQLGDRPDSPLLEVGLALGADAREPPDGSGSRNPWTASGRTTVRPSGFW